MLLGLALVVAIPANAAIPNPAASIGRPPLNALPVAARACCQVSLIAPKVFAEKSAALNLAFAQLLQPYGMVAPVPAASSKADQALIEQVLAEAGRENFVPGWLKARDVAWATDLIPHLPEPEASS